MTASESIEKIFASPVPFKFQKFNILQLHLRKFLHFSHFCLFLRKLIVFIPKSLKKFVQITENHFFKITIAIAMRTRHIYLFYQVFAT